MNIRQGSAQVLPRTPGPPGMSRNKKQGGAHRKPRLNDENANVFGPHQIKDNITGNAANFATPLGPKRTVLGGKDTNVIKDRAQPPGKEQQQPRTAGRSSTKTKKTGASTVRRPLRNVTPMQSYATPSMQPVLDNSFVLGENQTDLDPAENVNPERLALQRLLLEDSPESEFPEIEYIPPAEPEIPFAPDDNLKPEPLIVHPDETTGTTLIEELSSKDFEDEKMSYIEDDGINIEEILSNITQKRDPIKPSRPLGLKSTSTSAISSRRLDSAQSKTPSYMSLTTSARIRREASMKLRDSRHNRTLSSYKPRSESSLAKVARVTSRESPTQSPARHLSLFAEKDGEEFNDHDKDLESLYFNDL